MSPEQGKEPEKKAGTEVKEAAELEATDRMGEEEGSITVSKIRRNEKHFSAVHTTIHPDTQADTSGHLVFTLNHSCRVGV